MQNSHGMHIMVDYTGFFPTVDNAADWMINLMNRVIDESTALRVHSHIEEFDGATSPPGFAAVVLLDESHLTAHCYSQKGWLSIDCFTCGSTDTAAIITAMEAAIKAASPSLKLEKRHSENRFIIG
ncbi:MAG TPA: hypothetical protein HA354_00380 [Candidatus Poseidoniaceae archaeon]|nr:hypothetical protein [Candidatus Poseidoniaceae archaeon]